MVALLDYVDLKTTLQYLKIQVFDSIEFAAKTCPEFNNPKELFNWLKSKTKYTPDGENEYIQTMQTLFANGGRGDCDCYVVTALACFYVLGWTDCRVVLTGRNKRNAVHIYTMVKHAGEWYIFDLTNSKFDYERHYPYYQILNFKFN